MTGDRSLFKVFKSKKGENVTFGDRSKSQIKGKGTISLPRLPDITNVLYVEGLRVNLLIISQICDQDFMVLFLKGKCLILNEFGKKLISGVRTLDNCYGLYLMLTLCAIVFICQMKTYGTKGWDKLATNICQLYLGMNQCWEYQSSAGLVMLCVDHVSLGNR